MKIKFRLLHELATKPIEEDLIQTLRNQKRREWLNRGYDPELVEMALKMADSWIHSLADTFVPPDKPELRKQIIEWNYPKALEAAERWLIEMSK